MVLGIAAPLWVIVGVILYVLYRKGLIGGRR
jgi:hypothetical protein